MSDQIGEQHVVLSQVDETNWQAISKLRVSQEQYQFVTEPSYYLAMCAYGGIWNPLAISSGNEIIGFLMWAYDPEETSCWLGGFIIDQRFQRKGYGREALSQAIDQLSEKHGYNKFALSYKHTNHAARKLYSSFGFSETGEETEGEVIARLNLSQ